MSDEYCFAEHCRYRHWQSGSMPTHRKGDGCPKEYTPSTEEVRDAFASDEFGELKDRWAEEFDRWHQAELRRAKAEALRYMGRQFEIASEQGTGVRDTIAAQFCYDHAAEFEQEAANDHP